MMEVGDSFSPPSPEHGIPQERGRNRIILS
jgi:hypothetical protein